MLTYYNKQYPKTIILSFFHINTKAIPRYNIKKTLIFKTLISTTVLLIIIAL